MLGHSGGAHLDRRSHVEMDSLSTKLGCNILLGSVLFIVLAFYVFSSPRRLRSSPPFQGRWATSRTIRRNTCESALSKRFRFVRAMLLFSGGEGKGPCLRLNDRVRQKDRAVFQREKDRAGDRWHDDLSVREKRSTYRMDDYVLVYFDEER